MLNFPEVPKWWPNGNKFMKLDKPFKEPDYIIGYDTETYKGNVISQQFCKTAYGKKQRLISIQWVNDDNILDKFLSYCTATGGYIVVYCFNANFDLAILLRKFISKFLQDDFQVYYKQWEFNVYCSRNWYAYFKSSGCFVSFLDIHNFFQGTLDKVSKSFHLEGKAKQPENLGQRKFTIKDKGFVEYALQDARLCCEIGEHLLDFHSEFDVPISTSSANLAEKVFRRKFLEYGDKVSFPPWSALRLAELTYHGGKNGYYIDGPALIHKCYEYDFNSAYPSAMYELPSFLSGKYQKVKFFDEKNVGVYEVTGMLQPCTYGCLYDTRFNYFRFGQKQIVKSLVTSFELAEAIKSKEFKIHAITGWVWKPSTTQSPLREYSKFFWEKKNSTSKKDVRYLFYKLLLNSLYGKWIQRNPYREPKYIYGKSKEFKLQPKRDVSGGLYQPFIATLITGYVRARLHSAEHYFSAIESSTDSVKSRKLIDTKNKIRGLGVMELDTFSCDKCNREITSFTGLFVRNRLNVLMDRSGHILKAALHGFWGKPEKLLDMFKNKQTVYTQERMPMIREALKQQGKPMFDMYQEERSLNIDWNELQVIK